VKRREFLEKSVAAGLSAAAARALAQDVPADVLPRRAYGETGRELSIVGLGGIVVMNEEQAHADEVVARAFERGVNYFDVAPSYGDAQNQLGPALEPFRSDVFLACKSAVREADGCRAEMEESLRILRTDHFDLYQLHGLPNVEEAERCLAPGGALETVIAARERGEVLHIGFSAHSVDAALLLMDQFAFDSVLFPFNCVAMANGGFGRQVLDDAAQRGVARLALKALAWRPWSEGAERTYPKCWYEPIAAPELARLALYSTLDLPVTAALPPGEEDLFELAVELGLRYRPSTDEEKRALVQAIEGVEPIFRQG